VADKIYYAHSDPNGKLPEEGGHWQLLKDHLLETAELAKKFASAFDAGDWGYLAGLLHDAGKYSEEFQQKLFASTNSHIENKSKVDHSTFAAKVINKQWPKGEGKLLAYILAGHHSGLPDGKSNEDSCLSKRLNKNLPYHFECPEETFNHKKPGLAFNPQNKRFYYEVSFLTRMLYATLVDADFLNTEKHMNENKTSLRGCEFCIEELQKKLNQHLKNLQNRSKSTYVNSVRSEILKSCLNAAEQHCGLFSLTVPTGGGKTLSSIAFALKHADKHKLKRIIYVIPFTSIIEQNANVFRDVFGNEAVLEHHSNFEPDEEDYRSRLASENWDAPIVVTTNVQFFESLYANRSSRCRKLHNIAESVIILDEVQTLPNEYLLPCIEVLRELTLHYKTSIVLCSATQPALQKSAEFIKGLENVHEIIPDPAKLSSQMKRVVVEVIDKQLDCQLIERMNRYDKFLCIVNTKKHAKKLYNGLNDKENTFHLSTLMYPLHRSRKLKQIKKVLKENRTCRVISTQLIEAGVDIDFPVVFRSISGLDSIAQAAGRCNREGNLDRGYVYVFEPEDKLPGGYFRQTAQTAESVISRFKSDILSLEAIETYFKDYYWLQGNEQLDGQKILPLLEAGKATLDFPFKTIAERFKLISEDTKPVVITIEPEAQKIINDIRFAESLRGFSRKLQKFTVQIAPWYCEKLRTEGHIEIVREIFPVLTSSFLYNDDTGLNIYDTDDIDPCNLITS
jgi:CRISPR-associated endonuclease/helicase Cas3